MATAIPRRPDWIKVRFNDGPNYKDLKRMMRDLDLHTVCEEARCPNIYECWEHRAATFMLLGDTCTRRCAYCAVTTGRPGAVDWGEPERVARAVEQLGLRHVVVTSVNRDDLEDGGALIFAQTIRKIHEYLPDCSVEVLIPDFQGKWDALQSVIDARPEILNHNIETVPRVFKRVRSKGSYDLSLELLERAKVAGATLTKSGIIAGMGETPDEIVETMADLRAVMVDVITIGQYLRPTLGARHLPVERYYTPEEFAWLNAEGLKLGFKHVESGPLVRSSYHAWEQTERAKDLPEGTLAPVAGKVLKLWSVQ